MTINSELTPPVRRALNVAKRLAVSVPGVTGVDYGAVYKDRIGTSEHGIRFHVSRKLPLSALKGLDVLPRSLDGIRCDVVEAAYTPHASVNPCGSFDPIVPGISVGNLNRATSGTLGAFACASDENRPLILSNWHVLCGSIQAGVGEPICQPSGLHAGSTPARVIGRVTRLTLLGSGYDAAVARLEDGIAHSPLVHGLDLTIAGIIEPALGMPLVKSAPMSRVTHAIVDGIDGAFRIDYRKYGDTERWMDGIRLIALSEATEISLEGDSGAVWMDPHSSAAVALNFAGEDGLGPLAEYALAHPIRRVCELLRVEI